jgi:ATP-dependent DNA helicase RecQ
LVFSFDVFEEEMGDCGQSCDVCLKTTLDDLSPEDVGRPRKTEPRFAAGGRGIDVGGLDDPLFLRLKTLRRSLADAQGVPAYIVFSDAVLVRLAERRPRTLEEFRTVPGIGPAKEARYGEAFLRALNESPAE